MRALWRRTAQPPTQPLEEPRLKREESGGPWECPLCGHSSDRLTAAQIAEEVDGGLPRCGRGGCRGVLWPGGALTRMRAQQLARPSP
jgi:hypothetical protein